MKRIEYISNHPHLFDRITIPILICLLKLAVELGAEVVSLILTASFKTVQNVVINFISMLCISQLDQMYFLSIRSVLKDQLIAKDYRMDVTNLDKKDVKSGLHWFDKMLLVLTDVLQVLYQCIYFYMFPMLIYILVRWEDSF